MNQYYLISGLLSYFLWKTKDSSVFNSSDTMALSPVDPNSYARTDLVKTTHVHLDVEVDFSQEILKGHVIISFEKVDLEASSVVMDARNLTISKVSDAASGQVLDYELGSPSGYGEKLEVKLPSSVGKEFNIRIDYQTSPKSSALQWLKPSQTAGKKHPYVFSQCQAIHCRSMLQARTGRCG